LNTLSLNFISGNIEFPTSDTSLRALADEFKKISPAVPNVVAAVDSLVFETIAPTAQPFDDTDAHAPTSSIGAAFNRKGYFAVTVLAFVDAHMRILSLSMSCQTSSHDSTLFQASNMGMKVSFF
jgi:hypothetical protein